MGDNANIRPPVPRISRWVCGLAALALAACSGPPPATFDLSAAELSKALRGRGQLVVLEPAALQVINSDRIIVRPKDGQVTYLPGAQWAERLPTLVQARLIQTFQNAHRLGSVGSPDDKIVADALLVSEIRNFEIDASQGPVAIVAITVKLVDSAGKILAAKIFEARVPAAGTSGPQATAALDSALQQVLRDIVVWASPRA